MSYLDSDWRERRGLLPCRHMLNFYLAVILLFFWVSGFTFGGLAIVGQYPCVHFQESYEQHECYVHDGVVAQYSLEGCVSKKILI